MLLNCENLLDVEIPSLFSKYNNLYYKNEADHKSYLTSAEHTELNVLRLMIS
jgi:hypothetical protein